MLKFIALQLTALATFRLLTCLVSQVVHFPRREWQAGSNFMCRTMEAK